MICEVCARQQYSSALVRFGLGADNNNLYVLCGRINLTTGPRHGKEISCYQLKIICLSEDSGIPIFPTVEITPVLDCTRGNGKITARLAI